MKQAILEWRLQPAEIDAGLIADGINILDWHDATRDEHGRLKLSSRRLLGLIERLWNTEPYRRSTSASGWSELEELTARTGVEIAVYRASKYAGSEYEYEPDLPVPPKDRWKKYVEDIKDTADVEDAREDTFSDMGFT